MYLSYADSLFFGTITFMRLSRSDLLSEIKTAISYIFLSTILTKAFIPERFAVFVEICGQFYFLKVHLKLIPPTWTSCSKKILIGSFK